MQGLSTRFASQIPDNALGSGPLARVTGLRKPKLRVRAALNSESLPMELDFFAQLAIPWAAGSVGW